MIASRIRTLFIVGLAGLLMGVLGNLWFNSDPALAADTCTFKINKAKSKIGVSCRSSGGNVIPVTQTLSREGTTQVYSFTATGCKSSVKLSSNTKGVHNSVDRLGLPATSASCPGFPTSQGNVTVTQSATEDPAKDAQQDQENAQNCQEGATLQDGKCEESEGEPSSCQVDGIGWIVCPVMNFLSKTNDAAYEFIDNLLAVPIGVFSNDGAITAWEQFRTIANIAFVIVFMIIIYSQITGAGLSNYGIKKLLPKLVVTAILVNISFYLCAIAVDISNIVGNSVYDTFKAISVAEDTPNPTDDSRLWETTATGILGATAFIGFLLLIVLAPASLLAFALVIFILIARQAFVILLVVMSPLAFVAYLLPNTEAWFKKWWKALSAMLMVYPIIGAVFGVSWLASEILLSVAQNGDNNGDDSQTMAIMAAAVLAIPLFAVPGLLKAAMSGAGTIGARLSGYADKAQGRASGQVGDKYKGTSFARGRALRQEGRDEYRKRQFARAVAGEDTSRLGRARRRLGLGLPGVTPGGEYSRNKLQSSALASVTASENKEYEEAVSAAKTAHAIAGISTTDLASMAATGKDKSGQAISEHARAAAIDKVMSSGSFDERRSALEGLAGDRSASKSLRARATEGAFAKGDNAFYGNGFGQDVIDGKIAGAADLAAAAVKNAEGGNVTAEQWASSGAGAEWLATVSAGSQTAKDRLRLADDAARVPGTATSAKLMDKHDSARSKL